ncbi:MAG: 50S ribosomal protein L25 [Candidatus Paceibacterota bacterium]
MHTLEITTRDGSVKNDAVRTGGKIPAVFYGRKEKATPIAVDEIDFIKLYREVGESTVITLKGQDHTIEALVKDIQVDPILDRIIHVDFYALEKGKKVSVSIPLNFIGVSPAVKDLGGNLVKVMYEVEIEALPKDLIHSIDVDISVLADFDAQIHIKDLKVPAGIEVMAEPADVVALAEPANEEVEEETPAVDLTKIEVEKKGKKEEESTEGASTDSK